MQDVIRSLQSKIQETEATIRRLQIDLRPVREQLERTEELIAGHQSMLSQYQQAKQVLETHVQARASESEGVGLRGGDGHGRPVGRLLDLEGSDIGEERAGQELSQDERGRRHDGRPPSALDSGERPDPTKKTA